MNEGCLNPCPERFVLVSPLTPTKIRSQKVVARSGRLHKIALRRRTMFHRRTNRRGSKRRTPTPSLVSALFILLKEGGLIEKQTAKQGAFHPKTGQNPPFFTPNHPEIVPIDPQPDFP